MHVMILRLACLCPAVILSIFVAADSYGGDKPRRKIKYIDVHTHIGRHYWGKELTVRRRPDARGSSRRAPVKGP
jgi:hypothetical protein